MLKTQKQKIVDENGENIILKGVGFGGWLLQEPYMMNVAKECSGGQHVIFENVEKVIGRSNFEVYRKTWLKNYCSIEDIKAVKTAGFNSIRLPLHYNLLTLPIEQEPKLGTDTWIEAGFLQIDEMLKWCSEYHLYLILDLHALPGGQGHDANISDYDPSKPSVWESGENKRKTIALWEKLARRYSDKPWIGGYDIINETNWGFEGKNENGSEDTENVQLKELSEDIIKAIRTVDTNHIVFVEGNAWGNNHKGLWPINDDNVVLSFHKYWDENNYESIAKYIQISKKNNIPLWLGESGENSEEWTSEAIQLVEKYNIGWSWWTWKKMDSHNHNKDKGGCPFYTIKRPEGYDELIAYWRHFKNEAIENTKKPSEERAFAIMMQLAENVKIENCIRNNRLFYSCFR